MPWFYRGGKKPPTAHWFDPGAEVSLCTKLKPDSSGVVWRHPQHDRHVGLCHSCEARLKTRQAIEEAEEEEPETVEDLLGVKENGGEPRSR